MHQLRRPLAAVVRSCCSCRSGRSGWCIVTGLTVDGERPVAKRNQAILAHRATQKVALSGDSLRDKSQKSTNLQDPSARSAVTICKINLQDGTRHGYHLQDQRRARMQPQTHNTQHIAHNTSHNTTHNASQHNTSQHNTSQHNTPHHSTQHNVALHSDFGSRPQLRSYPGNRQ